MLETEPAMGCFLLVEAPMESSSPTEPHMGRFLLVEPPVECFLLVEPPMGRPSLWNCPLAKLPRIVLSACRTPFCDHSHLES